MNDRDPERAARFAEHPALLFASSYSEILAATRIGIVVNRTNPSSHFGSWRSDSGAPWPWKDEFEVGCALEHAGYYVTWRTAFFGPAKSVTSFASCLVPDKKIDVPLDRESPDFRSPASVSCRASPLASPAVSSLHTTELCASSGTKVSSRSKIAGITGCR